MSSNALPEIRLNREPSSLQKSVKILGLISLTVFVIAAVALAILITLSHFAIIHDLSYLILYVPPAATGGISALLGFVALVVYLCNRVSNEEEITTAIPPPIVDPPVQVADIRRENRLPE